MKNLDKKVFNAEYVHKINDPYPDNLDERFNYIYKMEKDFFNLAIQERFAMIFGNTWIICSGGRPM